MKNALNQILWCAQMFFLAVAMVLFFWPAQLLFATGRALRDNLGNSLMRGPYYWLCVQRRKLKGEPLWQAHDLVIGVLSPEMQQTLNEVKQMVPGPVPIMKMTNADVVNNLRKQAQEWFDKAEELSKLPPDEPFQVPLQGGPFG